MNNICRSNGCNDETRKWLRCFPLDEEPMGPSAFRHSTVPSWKPHHKVHSSITFWLVKNNDVTIYNPLTTVDFFLQRLLEHWWWIPQPRLSTNSVTSYPLEAKTLLIMMIKSVRSHNLNFILFYFILISYSLYFIGGTG